MGAGLFCLRAHVAPHSRRLVYRVAQVESVGLFDRSIICALSVYLARRQVISLMMKMQEEWKNDNENAA